MAQGKRDKDKQMAADLKARGIFHGRRLTRTCAPCVPSMGEVGSAAYRRLLAKKGVVVNG